MYLKKLIIEGFKSFAQRTEFDFADGVTAVVGPNGSGKSNVSDALRWVMGEANARELRGAKMEDVIFSGTQLLRAVNFAQVSLVLDNSEHIFPIDFPEVVVTRRVFKSGESEYEINKRSCRLKDISELFMDTGLGKGGYSVVGQGKIENILSTKSEERRGIFESAAGIAKYKHRKEEAERKLVQIDDNLDRVGDILSEIEGRIGPLERQAEKAKQYLKYREELKDADVNVMLRAIDDSREKLSQTETQEKSVMAQVESNKEAITKQEAAIDRFYESINELERQNTALTEQTSKLQQEQTMVESAIELKKNNRENWQNQIQTWEKEIETLAGQQEVAKEAKDKEKASLTALQNEINELLQKQKALQNKMAEHEKVSESKRGAAEQYKSDVMEYMNAIAQEGAKTTGADMLKRDFSDRKNRLLSIISEKETAYQAEKESYDKLAKKHAQEKQDYIEKQESLKQDRIDCQQKREAFQENAQKLLQKEQELTKAEAKAKLLADLREEGDGYPKAVKEILKGQKSGKLSGILGSVGSVIRVEEEYITAIETALGPAVNHVITKEEDHAKAAITYLKQNDFGRVTFLPLTSVKANRLKTLDGLKNCEGYVAVASDLVDSAVEYRGIVENLLGRTLVMDNMDHAVALSRREGYRFRIVTLDGGVCNVGGSLTGGSSHYKSSVLAGGVYLKKTQKRAEELRREILLLRQDKSSEEFELTKMETELKNRAMDLEDALQAWQEKDRSLSATYAQLTYLKEALAADQKELDTLGQSLNETSDQQNRSKEKLQKLQQKKAEAEQAVERLNKEMALLNGEEDKLFKEETALTIALAEKKKDKEMKQQNFARAALEEEQYEKQLKEKQNAIQLTNEKLAQEKVQIEQKEAQKEQLAQKLSEVLQGGSDYSRQKENLADSLGKAKEAVAHLRESGEVLTGNQNALHEKKVRLSAKFDQTVGRLWEEYELSYSDADALRHDINLDSAKQLIRSHREAIRALGDVNVGAVDEYKETKERYDFMKNQVDDLTASKQDLHQLIGSMQTLMKEQFEESFAKINENFSVVFRQLFGGGTASLSLEDPNDVLSSNIVIHVQPPGKKLQNINLMSGGEKALSAISLLFAILRMKPTPFCILDEIDAPLDEVNVDSFASYLHDYSHHTQFIMITHRQGTMNRADEIYGVTMQRRGISTVLKMASGE